MTEYLRLFYELPAIVAGTTMLAFLSPWKFQARFAPLLMFAVALAVLSLPEWIAMALCLTLPAAWLQGRLGIELHDHDPLRVTLPPLKIRRPKLTLQRFVTRAYPDPDAEETAGPDVADEDDELPQHAAGETVTEVPKFVPRL